jgi:hypothetical protein
VKRSILLAAASASLLLVLTACSGAGSSPSTSQTPPPADIQGGTQPGTLTPIIALPDSDEIAAWCPLDTPPVHLHQLTTEVTSAAVCSTSLSAEGLSTTTVSAVSGGFDELLSAYAEPNAPVDATIVCTLQLEDPLLIWLTYPGERSYPVYAPVGPCGFPTDEAKAAFTALELTPVVSFTETPDGITTTDIGLGTPGAPAKETT